MTDRESFAGVYRAHRAAVFQYLHHRTRDRDLAEDLTSETFARALRGYGSYVARGTPIRAWLVTIARNLLADELKSARHRYHAPLPDSFDEFRWTSGSPDPAELVCREAVRSSMRRVVSRLNAEQARCITMRYFDERTVAETSVAMRRSAGAVRALQNRGIHSLREVLTTGAIAS
ncbi:RNA polymerase sigma factor [Amycolatopsis methanolica]|uniref:Putative RNA polymerase sigma factor n=1 Tax=Amycolatopsis methanolica 239 TaxID=1068978 RepID=A0A076N3Y8_AMYME|nr:sigma-70 family RNA polymerase sigma factor [Amycolatopsis methanolica]AIJ24657.1 putative RNA polymerase sigma factor [Amycolatopsis methanolica 239]